jgi:hypothetical protein
MAESRSKSHHVLLSTDGKTTTLELYDAALWPDKTSGDGMFRVRIDGRWYSAAGKYTFLTLRAVGDLIARILSGDPLFDDLLMPDIPINTRVTVHYGDCILSVPERCEGGWTVAPPFRAVDGNFYVFVSTCGGVSAYPLHDVDIVSLARRRCAI